MTDDHYIAWLEEERRVARRDRDDLASALARIRAAHTGCTADTCTTIAAIEATP